MRLFFGLDIDPALARELDTWRLAQGITGTPVPQANFHVTLAFLGEFSDAKTGHLEEATDAWVSDTQPPCGSLRLDEVGYWPKPGLFWLGPSTWADALTGLAQGLGSLGVRFGAARERKPYRPHITLARQCQQAPPAPLVLPGWQVDYASFTLFESRQGRASIRYHPRCSWALA
ncbi:MAG: RNA 2',3'-cyclic phosphodiesterase [Pseudomonadota bacterium]